MGVSQDINRIKDRHRRFVRRDMPDISQKGVNRGAEAIAEEARARVPVRTGDLQRSIMVYPDVSPTDASGFVGSEPPPLETQSAVVVAGDPKRKPIARWVELGTQRSAAHPFLRPAMDASQSKAIKESRDTMEDGIPKAIGNHGVNL